MKRGSGITTNMELGAVLFASKNAKTPGEAYSKFVGYQKYIVGILLIPLILFILFVIVMAIKSKAGFTTQVPQRYAEEDPHFPAA